MGKPFRSYQEQIEILRSRGMQVDDMTLTALKRENYYCVVNGYKDFFLEGRSPTEQYKDGTTFSDLYTLFLFDRELRSLFLRRLLEVEAHMRTAIAYRASEHFSDDAEFYLDPLSYSGRPEDAERVGTLIEKLQKNREADTASLSHYRKTHGEVPFWVLVNYVTFGTLSYFYKLIKPRGIQQRVVNDLKSFYLSQRGRKARFTVERLTRDLWVLVDFRNACAHDERLYNHICKRINTNPEEPANVAYLLNILNQYLDADSSDTMTSDLIGLIDSLADREGLSRNTVLRVMLAIGLKIEPQG